MYLNARQKQERNKQITALYEEGSANYAELAEMFNVSHARIWEIINKPFKRVRPYTKKTLAKYSFLEMFYDLRPNRVCCVCGTLLTIDNCKKSLYRTGWYICKQCHRIPAGSESRKSIKYKSRRRIILLADFTCKHCKLHKPDNYAFFDIDHIEPINCSDNRGELKVGDLNLQVLCPNCHRMKTIEDRKNGKIIHKIRKTKPPEGGSPPYRDGENSENMIVKL